MKLDCYFDECKDCLHREYNDDFVGCLSNRLGFAWHRLIKELPLINKLADDYRYCHWYQKEE